jgi:hypothetical protein
MWTWGLIIERYQFALNDPRYMALAQGMLSVIPKLREHPKFAVLEPSMALLALTLRLPGYYRTIHLYCEQPDLYSIYLDHCQKNFCGDGHFYGEQMSVSSSELMPTLETYVHILQQEKASSLGRD